MTNDFTAKAISLDTGEWIIGNLIYRKGDAFIYCSDTDETHAVKNDSVCLYSGIDCTEDGNDSIFMNDILMLSTEPMSDKTDIGIGERVIVESIDGQPFFVTIDIFHKNVKEKIVCPLAWVSERLEGYGLKLIGVEVIGNTKNMIM